MNLVTWFILILPAMLIATILMIAAKRVDRLVRESVHWPSVQGRVTAARIRRTRNTRAPRIDYTYEVRGVRYRGNRFSFVQQSLNMSDCRAVLDRFPPDAMVPVWYDPLKPAYSVLERKGSATALRVAAATVLVLFLFVLVILELEK
ncbi:DUF3592 domain-containing protein [Sphingomonas sp.]|uniref:DUF3592 domain-containing protein n=1 Tax=Sphingomonas sp. TaxID=28214 RepID=UPI001EBD4EE8|nr:DUF3592 domain-containing protein [Sphingomonas sp.]MBX3593815.1 DUF3592 domain-containing protein [Sphingomonas sp.]